MTLSPSTMVAGLRLRVAVHVGGGGGDGGGEGGSEGGDIGWRISA